MKQADETYRIAVRGFLGEDQLKSLILLYQPLCRASALALYMTLYVEGHSAAMLKTPYSHARLMKMTQMNIDALNDDFSFLEGLGLVTEYRAKEDALSDYLYEVNMPLDADDFFASPLRDELLHSAMESMDYDLTRYCFAQMKIDEEVYENTSKSFADVFHLRQTETKETSNGYDMEMFYRGLKDYQIPRRAITKEIAGIISSLGMLYGIAPSLMRELVYDVYRDGRIDPEDLKERIRRYHEFENSPAMDKKDLKQQKIDQMTNTSPAVYLQALQHGAAPTRRDLLLLDRLVSEQKFSNGVVNVLVETVLYLDHGQLPKNHLEYLAGWFARRGVKTTEEAMAAAKEYIANTRPPDEEKMPENIAQLDEEETRALKQEIARMLKEES